MSYNPNVLEFGKTIQSGTVNFDDQKEKTVTFPNPFSVVPVVLIVLDYESNAVPYVINVTITGCKIKFKSKYTGNVIWEAKRTN